jgi:hypothetical protein
MKSPLVVFIVASFFAAPPVFSANENLLPGQTKERGRYGSFYPVEANDPPAGFRRAICRSGQANPSSYCMAKIMPGGSHPTISIWTPPVRESGGIDIYVGNCLNTGCQFLGPDRDYPGDPVRYTLFRLVDPSSDIYELRTKDFGFRLIIPRLL